MFMKTFMNFLSKEKMKICLLIAIILWGLMALVSVNHLYPFCHALQVSSSKLGYLAWSVFACSIGILGYRFWKELIIIFFLFFGLGWSVGPFLEPPSDPLDHLARSYSICGKTSVDVDRTNRGLWQYNMLGNMLCHERYSRSPKEILHRIDIANGMFWAFSASILFIVGLRAGLPAEWAFFSICLAFLFMGTNRFSYFSYYSFAAGFSSMWVYWLWIAAFFFKQKARDILLPGILAAGVCLPILAVNHIQEAIFLALICGVWILYFLVRSVASYFSEQHRLWRCTGWWLFLSFLIIVFFILPQWGVVQAGLRHLFIRDNWQAYQKAVVTWHGLHFIGKIWRYRVHDTLGFFGILPLLMVPLFVFSKVIEYHNEKKWLILLLGLLPFCVYFVPLLNFVWTSNCLFIEIYYRICYSSLFWIPISLVLCNLGLHTQKRFPENFFQNKKLLNSLFLSFCFLCSVLLACIQSGPIYGKIDFITVDSKKWWAAWQPMIEEVFTWKKEEIETDYITGYVLNTIFDIPLKYNQLDLLSVDQIPKRSIENMVINSNDDRIGCLINLHRFQATWVPQVTGHWQSALTKPDRFYQLDKKKGEKLSDYLRENTPGSCYVFY
jgi:hypothetical protein